MLVGLEDFDFFQCIIQVSARFFVFHEDFRIDELLNFNAWRFLIKISLIQYLVR